MPSAAESEQGRSATWSPRESGSRPIHRSVQLPFAVDADQAEATFAHGAVRIVLPEAAGAKPQRLAATAASGQPEVMDAGSCGLVHPLRRTEERTVAGP